MSKVLFLRGLPAAGKSCYAKELVKEGWKRVNKDDIRMMVDSGKYSRANEKLVLEIRDMIIDLALIYKQNIVVDDTNFEEKHSKQVALLAKINKAEFEVKFFDTPLEVCIKRDTLRKNSVGKDVIERMYFRYIKPHKTQ